MKKRILILTFCLSIYLTYGQNDSTGAPKPLYQDTTTTSKLNNAERDTISTTQGILPVFSTASSDLGGANLQSQDINALLGSSRDIFMQAVAMHFTVDRFRYRGYLTDNMTVMMNGVRLNSLETGVAGFSTFGGMNDVMRFMDQKTGLGSSRSSFGDVGGFFNLNVYASTFRKGIKVTYSEGNRIFKQRATLTYSTGLLKNGWAFAFSGTARYAAQGYVPGTWFQGFGFYAGADKKLNDRNTLALTLFGAPITQARQAYATDEAYALTGDKHYNPDWGFQNGVARNGVISKTNLPTLILTDRWEINDHSRLTVNASGSYGRTSLTGGNYFGANTPAQDYYKYMPSYYAPGSSDADPSQFAAVTQAWLKNTVNPLTGFNAQQLDWDGMYNVNAHNVSTTSNVDGVAGSSYTGKRSLYIIEEKRQDVRNGGYNAIYNTRLSNDVYITAGTNGAISNTRYYKVVNDLLGGDYWLDYNQFGNSLTPNPLAIQNNINDPNKIIKQGDVFGYDYNINVNRFELWGQAEKSFKRVDLYLSATVNNTSFYRAGHMVNGLFPTTAGINGAPVNGSSGGNSNTLDFLNYGVKGGLTYKIDGRNYISVNAASITKPPLPTNAFLSPQTRNDELQGIGSEKIFTGDISYNVRLRWLKGRITYYYTQINNQVWHRSYYDNDFKTSINFAMTNLNQLNQGLELGLEGIVNKHVSIIAAVGYGSYLYTNDPSATITANNSAQLLAMDRTVYFKNYHVGGAPESANSLGVRYNGIKRRWYAGVYFNYFANNYVTISPAKRTDEALSRYVIGDPQVNQILNQEKLPNSYTIDFMGGKSFSMKGGRGINLTLMVNNLTNNIFKTSGEEQLRYDDVNSVKFPNKYLYSFGVTFMLSASFTFN
jgi:hypothetical protein